MAKTKATALKALSGNLFDKEYAKRAVWATMKAP